MDENKMVSTGIKIERELLARLQKAADERCLGRNLLIRMALEKFLDDLIPIEQLTRKEGKDEQVDETPTDPRLRRYLAGESIWVRTSGPSEADPAGDSASLFGGARGPDAECVRAHVDVPEPRDVRHSSMPGGEGHDAG